MKKILSLNDPTLLTEGIQDDIDLIEWRLDLCPLNKHSVNKIKVPWIATLRHHSEGGRFEGDNSTRINTLKQALELGATWVDIEAKFPHDNIPISKLIRSVHLPNKPTNIAEAQKTLLKAPGSLKKWVRPTAFVSALLKEEHGLLESKTPTVVIHSGLGGLWTRVSPPGHPWSYVSLPSRQTAPGQIPFDQLSHFCEGSLYGIVGDPVDHSLSPALYNSLFKKHQKNNFYIPLPVKDLSQFLHSHKDRFTGFSVTTPFKEEILKFVSSADSICRDVQAANTLIKTTQGFQATNTDATGLKNLLMKHRRTEQKVVVIGCGGFGRAALWALRELNHSTTLVNRNVEKGQKWAEHFGAHFQPLNSWDFQGEDILIQATSAELKGDKLPFSTCEVSEKTMLIESVYGQETQFLSEAPSGCQKITGKDVLKAQATEQVKFLLNLEIKEDEINI